MEHCTDPGSGDNEKAIQTYGESLPFFIHAARLNLNSRRLTKAIVYVWANHFGPSRRRPLNVGSEHCIGRGREAPRTIDPEGQSSIFGALPGLLRIPGGEKNISSLSR